jgi:sortase (surface protein transpeptidase)
MAPVSLASEVADNARGAAAMDRSQPVELRIPSIGVISTLQHLGQAADGSLEVPAPGPRYNDAAWYKHSPTPGELGPAVLLGHVDSAADGPSVFFRLGELEPGDRVSVERADGATAVFTVDRVRRYSKDDFPTSLVYGDIDHAGLRILTCGGAFDDSTGHYLDNIVVFASLDAGSVTN